jgi:hypothetical protein
MFPLTGIAYWHLHKLSYVVQVICLLLFRIVQAHAIRFVIVWGFSTATDRKYNTNSMECFIVRQTFRVSGHTAYLPAAVRVLRDDGLSDEI